jgi:catechol 2,3-dioxygenase-like lactoylglutathione lyase family enzyme
VSGQAEAVLAAFAAVFTVREVAASLAFYRDRLGFKPHFVLGDPPTYAIIERDSVMLHLMPAARAPDTLGKSSIYVFAHGVDALAAAVAAAGAVLEVTPQDFDYGMREFSLRDPDGNRLTFGEEVRASRAAP